MSHERLPPRLLDHIREADEVFFQIKRAIEGDYNNDEMQQIKHKTIPLEIDSVELLVQSISSVNSATDLKQDYSWPGDDFPDRDYAGLNFKKLHIMKELSNNEHRRPVKLPAPSTMSKAGARKTQTANAKAAKAKDTNARKASNAKANKRAAQTDGSDIEPTEGGSGEPSDPDETGLASEQDGAEEEEEASDHEAEYDTAAALDQLARVAQTDMQLPLLEYEDPVLEGKEEL